LALLRLWSYKAAMRRRLLLLSCLAIWGVLFAPACARRPGVLSVKDLDETFQRYEPEVRRCYKQGLDVNFELRGDFTVRATIDPDGRVAEARIVDNNLRETGGRDVQECVVNRMNRWAFPKPKGDGSVTFSHRFELKGDVKLDTEEY
jgi:hypothetical protein